MLVQTLESLEGFFVVGIRYSMKVHFCLFLIFMSTPSFAGGQNMKPEIVTFESGSLTLRGELFKPRGPGPFPTVLYNHGSAPGMLSSKASAVIGPLFAKHGYAFFMPYRRGQGLSQNAGPYIVDEIKKAKKKDGNAGAVATLIRLLKGDHLDDQMAALSWIKKQSFVQSTKIAVAGNSFGGVEAVLGASQIPFCAAVSASGGAESWAEAPELQELMKAAVKNSQSPIFFFQAENDVDLSPSRILSAEMKLTGKNAEIKVYPPFGKSSRDGHSFAYRGSDIWFKDVLLFLNKYCVVNYENRLF